MRSSILLGSLLAVGLTSGASAATITSTPFSLGYGFHNNSWNTTETAAFNSLPTGDFSLLVTPSGTGWSASGPSFTNRTLGTSGGDYSGVSSDFQVVVSATYTGTPLDVDVDPGYQVQLNITSIRIWANGYSGPENTGTTVAFSETTPGHESVQSPATPTAPYAAPQIAGSYSQVVWNPDDFFSDVGTTTTTRTLVLQLPAGASAAIDGFEVFGDIVVTYNAIPEPAGLGLLAGGLLLAGRRRRFE